MGMGGQRHAPAALPTGKTRYPLYRKLCGPQGRSGQARKISPPPGFDPRTVQPVASRYTDWAVPAHHVVEVITHVFLSSRDCHYTDILQVSTAVGIEAADFSARSFPVMIPTAVRKLGIGIKCWSIAMCRWQKTQLTTRVGVVQGVVNVISGSVSPISPSTSGIRCAPRIFLSGGGLTLRLYIIYVWF